VSKNWPAKGVSWRAAEIALAPHGFKNWSRDHLRNAAKGWALISALALPLLFEQDLKKPRIDRGFKA
jgi:hypothetical protein